MEGGYEHSIILGLSIFNSILFLCSSIFIRKKKNHLFLSLRSTNILHVINTNIFFSTIIVWVLFYFHINDIIQLILEFLLLICHIITFASITCKYVRFYKCTQICLGDDDLTDFKNFKQQKYYYEYFYIRSILILFGVCTIVLTIVTLVLVYGFKEFIIKNNEYFPLIWIIPFFMDNMILLTCTFLVRNKNNLGGIKTELIILLIYNYISSFTISLFSLFVKKEDYNGIIGIIGIICLLYLIILQGITILYPIIICWLDKVTFGYHITKESTKDLYLFLSNEKCYNSFESFLMSEQERENNRIILDLYTHIIQYRIKFMVEDIHLNKLNEGKLIHKKYFDKDKEILFTEDDIILNMRKKNENLLKNNECKFEMFDEALEKAYSYLNGKYNNFKQTDEFAQLINEIDYDTYIWCKLADCGLIKK